MRFLTAFVPTRAHGALTRQVHDRRGAIQGGVPIALLFGIPAHDAPSRWRLRGIGPSGQHCRLVAPGREGIHEADSDEARGTSDDDFSHAGHWGARAAPRPAPAAVLLPFCRIREG